MQSSKSDISRFFAGPRLLHKQFAIDAGDLALINPSYSMSGEDLIVRNLLKAELRSGSGFYADLGAFEPCFGSNTYLFYQYGWRGVCVEPNPRIAAAYRTIRPNDTFLEAAIGPDGSGWWAESNIHPASSRVGHSQDEFGADFKEPVPVPFISLRTLFERHAPQGMPISFVSMDIEGFELTALQTNDWDRFRPKVILIEENNLQPAAPLASPALKFLNDLGYRIAGVVPPNVVMVSTLE